MIKVLLVDDEVLALEYLKGLVPWEELGFEIVGSAMNGNRALEVMDKVSPDVVISDIRMAGMDGLALAREIQSRNNEVIVILVSAYKDFNYAQKGIQYGVTNYLIKHELSKEMLSSELEKVKEVFKDRQQKSKIYQQYFVNQLIYTQAEANKLLDIELGNRFFLVFINKNSLFCRNEFTEQSWSTKELAFLNEVIESPVEDNIKYITDAHITSNNLMVLYKIENTTSKYTVKTVTTEKVRAIAALLADIPEMSFNIIYSDEIKQNEISNTFRQMSKQIRGTIFWRSGEVYNLNQLSDPEDTDKVNWSAHIEELKEMLYTDGADVSGLVRYIFEMTYFPTYKIGPFKELTGILENLINDIENKECISRVEEQRNIFKAFQIQEYYEKCFCSLQETIRCNQEEQYSNLVVDMMRYIRRSYREELSLEQLGELFNMNGVYLGQIFKKEVGTTFLKYVTGCRIDEAKRLLHESDMNITEVADEVGYKTSQYFSQIFLREVGMKPQEYKKWSKRK